MVLMIRKPVKKLEAGLNKAKNFYNKSRFMIERVPSPKGEDRFQVEFRKT